MIAQQSMIVKSFLRKRFYYQDKYGIADHMAHKGVKDYKYKMRLNGYFAYWKSIEDSESVKKLHILLNSRRNIVISFIEKAMSFISKNIFMPRLSK